MEQNAVMDALAQAKRFGNKLNEVLDLSQQIAEALDRNDQVSVEMLVSMRRDPIESLQAADQALRDMVETAATPEDGLHLAELLGGEGGDTEMERTLSGQAASNGRRLKQVLELDKILNQKITREKSAYS